MLVIRKCGPKNPEFLFNRAQFGRNCPATTASTHSYAGNSIHSSQYLRETGLPSPWSVGSEYPRKGGFRPGKPLVSVELSQTEPNNPTIRSNP